MTRKQQQLHQQPSPHAGASWAIVAKCRRKLPRTHLEKHSERRFAFQFQQGTRRLPAAWPSNEKKISQRRASWQIRGSRIATGPLASRPAVGWGDWLDLSAASYVTFFLESAESSKLLSDTAHTRRRECSPYHALRAEYRRQCTRS